MKTVGIIAEYNPFHRGHEYQIQEIRRCTGAEHIVVVMSGDFIQRGGPAWTDKFLRTEMALAGGADLVFELPVHFATASAEGFALGGISLLHQLGFVDGICFGCECGNLEALSTLADFLVTQESHIQEQIQIRLSHGMTYPAARAEILALTFPELIEAHPGLLNDPNNILGIEYLKALRRLNSSIKAFIIPRQGGSYHDISIEQEYPSASAIRSYYAKTGILPIQGIPTSTRSILNKHIARFPLTDDDLSDLLYYKLRSMGEDAYTVCDMTSELWNRIQKQLPYYQTFSQFTERLKTKQVTHTRIQRVLLHLLLDLHPAGTYAAYARLLGFHPSHSALLRSTTAIPILTKVADQEKVLHTPEARQQLSTDLFAHDLYRYLIQRKYPSTHLPDDFHSSPCIAASDH